MALALVLQAGVMPAHLFLKSLQVALLAAQLDASVAHAGDILLHFLQVAQPVARGL
ncbi:hypothetical protein D3C71_2057840 [compost metagenome]